MSYGIIVRDEANVSRTITAIQVRDETNTERDISEVWVRDSNNVPRLVFSPVAPLTLAIDPPVLYGASSGSGTITTDPATATPTGGLAPFTYSWVLEDYIADTPPTANSPASATTTFTQTGLTPGDSASSSWQCEVTDDQGATATATCQTFFVDLP